MKRIFAIALLVLALAVTGAAQQQNQSPIAAVPDQELKTRQWTFNGAWMPSIDPALIGAENYRTLQNLRYTSNGGLEAVGGYTDINTTALGATIDAGFHFKKDNPAESHVLVSAGDSVYENTTAIPSAGDFTAAALHTDATGAGDPRFSKAPYGNVAYANGKESMIWGGDEIPVAAFITSTATVADTVDDPIDYTQAVNNDRDDTENVAVIGGGIDTETVLMLHMDGSDAGTTFTDSGETGHSPSAGGDAQTDSEYKKFGPTSGMFDGDGDYVSIADHANWNFGSGTVTIDGWARFDSVTGQHCLYSQGAATSYVTLFQDHDAEKVWFSSMSSGTRVVHEYGTWAPSADTWYHWALIRGWGGDSDDWAMTIDGSTVATFTDSGTLPDVAAAAQIGNMSKTVAVDFGNTGHGLTAQNNATISRTQEKWGSGSLYFDGTGDDFVASDHADFDIIGQTNATVDLWVKHTDHAGTEIYVEHYEDANNRWLFYHLDGTGLRLDVVSGAGTIVTLSGGEITDTDWHHVAAVKVGDDYGLYLDGTITAHVNDSDTDTFAGNLYLGIDGGGGSSYDGYMDDVRIYHGNPFTAAPDAGLTDTITIPTAAHASDSSTKFLVHGDALDFDGWMDEVRVNKAKASWTAAFTPYNRAYVTAARTFLIGSPRPLQGFKAYVELANSTTSTMTVKEWNGGEWQSLSVTDGTASGGATLAQTGSVTWTSTEDTSKVKYLEGRLYYWYQVAISAGDAWLYRVTLDADWQDIVDIWDGVERQCIQFQAYKSSKYEDYTLEVNNETNTYFGDLGGLTSAEHLIVGFEERMTAARFTMVSGDTNTTDSLATVYIWSGDDWVVANHADTTLDSTDAKSMNQSGVISWQAPSAEEESVRTLFGTTAYFYKIEWSANLSADCDVNLCTGIPAQVDVAPFEFPAIYKDRLFLCGYTEGSEGNRCDYSMTHAPQVFNGEESSMDGLQSLYFGGEEELKAGTQLYNRMGSNIFIFFLALKANETYVLTGDGPDDFQIFPVSMNVGCPAPYSLATAEMGFEIAQDVERHVAIWLSYSGPVMFDGAVIYQIPGLEIYFDPTLSTYVGQTYIDDAVGWFDQTHREYNLRVADYWFVYSLRLKRWYEKDTGAAAMPESAWPVNDTSGNQYVFAGLAAGQMVRLENGTSWDGTAITQKVQTGDFWPTDNIWDLTRIRRVKLAARRIADAHILKMTHYTDSDTMSDSDWTWDDESTIWEDSDVWTWDSGTPAVTIDLSGAGTTGSDSRLVRATKPMNAIAWTHGFGFEVTTANSAKAFQPVAWGIEYLLERKDH